MPDPVTGIIGGTTLVGNFLGNKGAKSAANVQAQGARDAAASTLQAQREQMDFLSAGRDQAMNILNQYQTQQQDLLSSLPSKVAPIYQQGYQQLESLGRTGAGKYSELLGQSFDAAGRKLQQGYSEGQERLAGGYGGARQSLSQMYGQARGNVQDLYGQSAAALEAGMSPDEFQKYMGQATGTIKQLIPETREVLGEGRTLTEKALDYDPYLYLQEQLGVLDEQADLMEQLGAPYMDYGQQGMDAYAEAALSPYTSPLFERKREEATEALQERLATMGLSQSSAAIEKEQDIIQDLTAQEQALAENRMLNLAQMGYGQAGTQQQLGGQLAGQQAAAYGQAGRAGADIEAGKAASLANLYQNLMGQEAGTLADVYGTRTGLDQAMASGVAGMDQQKAQMLAQLLMSQAGQEGAMLTNLGQNLSGLSADEATKQAALAGDQGAAQANLQTQQGMLQGQNIQNLYATLMGQQAGQTSDMANLTQQAILNQANLLGQTGTNKANVATGTAGSQAKAAQATGSNLANIAMQQGQDAAAAKLAQYGTIGQGIKDLGSIYGAHKMGYFNPAQNPTTPTAGQNPNVGVTGAQALGATRRKKAGGK